MDWAVAAVNGEDGSLLWDCVAQTHTQTDGAGWYSTGHTRALTRRRGVARVGVGECESSERDEAKGRTATAASSSQPASQQTPSAQECEG